MASNTSRSVISLQSEVKIFSSYFLQPFLLDKLKIHDTCGVNNLHGMPGLFGGLLSVLIAGIASSDVYDKFSTDNDKRYPGLKLIYRANVLNETH